MKVEDVEGIGPVNAEKLALIGITDTDALLDQGAKPGGRSALEQATGIDHDLILEWVEH